MANTVKIMFDADNRVHSISVPDNIKKGDRVVVKLENGNDLATVVSDSEQIAIDANMTFGRLATDQDKMQANNKKEKKDVITQKVKDLIQKYNLVLKLIKVHESFDGSKILVVYTAPERVDFRELVKELASTFRTHIEMRQVSEREGTCILGGFAECGQELCCRRFLNEPQSATIKMAKMQEVTLSPSKVNGVCGKLRCCLTYEHEDYKQILSIMPDIGQKVITPRGEGEVVYRDLFSEQVCVKFSENDEQNFDLSDIQKSA